MKSTVATQKLQSDETTQQERVRIRNEEEKKQKEIEDRLRTAIGAKEDLEVSLFSSKSGLMGSLIVTL